MKGTKKFTQAEFDAFPVVDGKRQCPTGDYTEIKHFGDFCSFGNHCSFGTCCFFDVGCSFGEWCSFGNHCYFGALSSFGEDCSFGEWCSFGECCSFKKGCVCEFGEFSQMCSFGGFGCEGRTTYAFALTDGNIGIRCGCFTGNLDEFRAKVKKTHGDSKLAKEYLVIADLVSLRFGEA